MVPGLRGLCILLVALVAGMAAVPTLLAQAPATSPGASDVSAVLAATREALGGEKQLGAVRSFVATGRTRQIRGNNLVPIEFEIACQFPDRYVRRDEIPAQESGPTSAGFNGSGLIQFPRPEAPAMAGGGGMSAARPATAGTGAAGQSAPIPPAGVGVQAGSAPAAVPAGTAMAAPPGGAGRAVPPMAVDPQRARVASLKQDFVKLTLGMFAASFDGAPVTFTLSGKAEAPQGTADIIDVKGADGINLRFFVDSQTHLPIMVSWTTPATNAVVVVPGQPAPENLPPGSIVVQAPPPPPASAPKEEQDAYARSLQDLRRKTLRESKPIEHRLYYGDYRDAGHGLKFPFRLRRAVAGETTEETNFDGFRINPRIDARRFEIVK